MIWGGGGKSPPSLVVAGAEASVVGGPGGEGRLSGVPQGGDKPSPYCSQTPPARGSPRGGREKAPGDSRGGGGPALLEGVSRSGKSGGLKNHKNK